MQHLLSSRANAIDASGIRRIFELGATLSDPYNFSIGQPDFPVPQPIQDAAIDAIREGRNGYTVTQGAADLLAAIRAHLSDDIDWNFDTDDDLNLLVTAGTSGGIFLAFMALLDPGDEVIIPDPYFVIYPSGISMAGGSAVLCDTYPDGRMTAARVAPLITEKTKAVLINSPGNPTGAVLSNDEMCDLVTLCEEHNVLLISDEIYDAFTYRDAREDGKCPSPARYSKNILLVRGFGKTYGCTGWRMGYAAGPSVLINAMTRLQQYTFVCAPSMAQAGLAKAFEVDMESQVEVYQQRRDMVIDKLGSAANIITPGGAFYAFIEIPQHLGMTGTEFTEAAIENNVLVIPGGIFSQRDTHFRLSYATSEEKLRGGLEILSNMLVGDRSAASGD